MNPIWHRLDELAGAAVNGVFAEDVRITPRIAGNEYSAAVPDAARAEITIKAIPAYEPGTDDLRGQRNSGDSRGTSRISVSTFSLQITAAELAKIGWEIGKNDLMTLTSRAEAPTFAVEHIDPLDCGDVRVFITKEKNP